MDRRILPAAPPPTTLSQAGPSSSVTSGNHPSVGYASAGMSSTNASGHAQAGEGGKRRAKKDKGAGEDEDEAKKKKAKRRKVDHACIYCRRSHMTCDAGRPCQRCIKREIGHLCRDEAKLQKEGHSPAANDTNNATPTPAPETPAAAPPQQGYVTPANSMPFNMQPLTAPPGASPVSNWPIIPPAVFPYSSQSAGNEFSVLTAFLQSLDDRSFFGAPQNMLPAPAPPDIPLVAPIAAPAPECAPQSHSQQQQSYEPPSAPTASPILPAATKTEQFLLTAADQESGTRDERLAKVIHSKYEAGLLKPYNYVKGYARLSRWMDRNVSQESKQQILGPLSVLRPKFRAIAQSLTDIDLVFIEEAFERLLLDYDRVFSAMGIPACLWRRTGEIYKGNREFAELVGVEGYMLREGRLCIYELMAEESAVNYWEKYGHVAFDAGQKAVLTSCVLRFKPTIAGVTGGTTDSPVSYRHVKRVLPEQGLINCCFSFTIRRDAYGIPSMIVGNFIRH